LLKYFSLKSERPEPAKTGGEKCLRDLQKTVENFLRINNIRYKEYNLNGKTRNFLYMILPWPNCKYLVFSYGTPVIGENIRSPFPIIYFLMFCFVAIKRRIFNEKFYLFLTDLIEWQSKLTPNRALPLRRMQFLTERMIVSLVANEVISNLDSEFLSREYRLKKIHDVEMLDYYIGSEVSQTDEEREPNILYAGELGRPADIVLIETVLANLTKQYNLLVAGYNPDKSQLDRLREFHNFRYVGHLLNVEELNVLARKCQFGLIIYPPDSPYSNITSPIKLPFYIVNGLTVVSTNLKKIRELNDKYRFGYTLSTNELIKFVGELSDERIRRNRKLEKRLAEGKNLSDIMRKLNLKPTHERKIAPEEGRETQRREVWRPAVIPPDARASREQRALR
jgi:hypothetical protein